jgi:hypothetical protein
MSQVTDGEEIMVQDQSFVAVYDWLMKYAWNEATDAERSAKVNCILSQDDWRHVDAVADKYAGQHESGGGPEAFTEAMGYALSALYECHDGPHTSDCPTRAYEIDAAIKRQKRDDEIAEGKFRTCRVLVPDGSGNQKQLGDSFILTNTEIKNWTPMDDDWTLQVLNAGAWINRHV